MKDVVVIDGMTGKIHSRIPRKVWDESVAKMGAEIDAHIKEREDARHQAWQAVQRRRIGLNY